MADMKLIKDMSAALNARPRQPEPYDTTAEVTRVEGDVAWVHIPGGVDETPVQMSVNAKIGDTVRVRVGGGTAWLTGNDTAPPTDDKAADEAQKTADEALLKVTTIEAVDIFADMIQTGRLNADFIQAGTIQDEGGNSSWDLDNGTINLTNTFESNGHTYNMDVIVSGKPDASAGPGLWAQYSIAGDGFLFWGPNLTVTEESTPDWLMNGKYGYIYKDGSVYIGKNDASLYGKNTSIGQTYVSLIKLSSNNNIVIGQQSDFGDMGFQVPAGQAFRFYNGNIILSSGATVDGVDVSDFASKHTVHSTTVTGTTSGNGGINSGLSVANNIILCVQNNGSTTYDLSIRSNGDTANYYISVRDTSNNLVTNTAVNLTVYYMTIS